MSARMSYVIRVGEEWVANPTYDGNTGRSWYHLSDTIDCACRWHDEQDAFGYAITHGIEGYVVEPIDLAA